MCEVCGKELNKRQKRRGCRFCSVKCRAIIIPPPKRGSSVLIVCKNCGKEKVIRKAFFDKFENHFCSTSCSNNYNKKTKENHWNWKDGKTDENALIRHSVEYKNWRNNVYKKNYYTCQECGYKGKDIVAHHIKSFNEYENLRFDVDNGITYCRSCHLKVHRQITWKVQMS